MRGCIIRVTKAALVPPFFSLRTNYYPGYAKPENLSLSYFTRILGSRGDSELQHGSFAQLAQINSFHRPAGRCAVIPTCILNANDQRRSRNARNQLDFFLARLRGAVIAAVSRALISSRNASYSDDGLSAVPIFVSRAFLKRVNVHLDSPSFQSDVTRLTLVFPWSPYSI